MTGAEQGTIDSNNGGYLSKASNFGPAIFKAAELVRIIRMLFNPVVRRLINDLTKTHMRKEDEF